MLNKISDGLNRINSKMKTQIFKNKLLAKVTGSSILLTTIITKQAYAAPQVGQNSATYILEQIFWVIIAVVIGLAAKHFSKGNTVKIIATVLLGGFVLVLCKAPTKIQTFGTWIFEILGL